MYRVAIRLTPSCQVTSTLWTASCCKCQCSCSLNFLPVEVPPWMICFPGVKNIVLRGGHICHSCCILKQKGCLSGLLQVWVTSESLNTTILPTLIFDGWGKEPFGVAVRINAVISGQG
ncbi:unnamed protein product, partial [Ectocarpus sp. 13 AM-2016]